MSRTGALLVAILMAVVAYGAFQFGREDSGQVCDELVDSGLRLVALHKAAEVDSAGKVLRLMDARELALAHGLLVARLEDGLDALLLLQRNLDERDAALVDAVMQRGRAYLRRDVAPPPTEPPAAEEGALRDRRL